MDYCKRCVYPANARPGIIFDEEGVCSGCRVIESRKDIDWKGREQMLVDLLRSYQAQQRQQPRQPTLPGGPALLSPPTRKKSVLGLYHKEHQSHNHFLVPHWVSVGPRTTLLGGPALLSPSLTRGTYSVAQSTNDTAVAQASACQYT